MSIFDRNLEVLESASPALVQSVRRCPPQDVKVLTTRSGDRVPVVQDRALHSTYRPDEEARAFADRHDLANSAAAVVLGLGFGYHAQALFARWGKPLVIAEKSLPMLCAALRERDLRDILSNAAIMCGGAPASVLTAPGLTAALQEGTCAVVAHEPSVRLAPGYYARVRRHTEKGLARSGDAVKVQVVSPLSGGSWPVARYAARGLEQNGCDVSFLDLRSFAQASTFVDESLRDTTLRLPMADLFHRFLCEFVYCKIRHFQPDLVLFLAQAPVSPELLARLGESGTRTAFWFVENHRLFPYWETVAPLVDHFFTIQRAGFFERLEAVGAHDHGYLPLACDPGVHRPVALAADEARHFGSDVSVAGFGYYNRLHFAQGLTDLDLKLWGPGWDRASALRPHVQDGGAEFGAGDMVKIFNASRINLNLHSSTHASGVEAGGDFVNPRTFEIAGCGAFQLTDCRTELPPLFEPDHEIATFRDFHELRSGIARYLRCADERRRIAAQARDRALAEHTYRVRMRQMLEAIYPRQYLEIRNARQEDLDAVSRLRAEAPAGHDLHEALHAAPDDARLSLAELARMLGAIPGPPGRQEITARWMQGILDAGLRR